jgi:uncharacterized protein YbcV (DUF1398 family)
MSPDVKDVIVECTRASDEGRVSFGEVVMMLMKAGVERYHADLVRGDKTFYLPNGESEVVESKPATVAPARDFAAAGVEAAVRAAQAGRIQYGEFCKLAAEAGCVGYIVSIVGQRVVYFGRAGDSHVEWFPCANRAKVA